MKEIIKFLGLGVISTAIDYSVYILLLTLDVNYVIAIIIGYSLGLMANFYIARAYIFLEGSKAESSHKEFIHVVMIAIVGVILNIAIVKLLSFYLFSIAPAVSRIIAIGIVFFWNYFMRKLFVYY